mmetsp:Transcript_15824/g.21416  ORF Transcript_15824/g.21416 Transcript_15824/m.21416 type:complete len:523 (+) Transcript_15824:66-1634(+)
MRNLLFAIASLCLGTAFGQNVDYMDHNNTRATLERLGNFFYDEQSGSSGYEVPNGSGNHTMYIAKFFFMGLDANGTLHASLGGSNNATDVFSGPYSSLNNYDSSYQAYWSGKSWQICQEEIDIYTTWWEACQGPNQDPTACANAVVPSNALLTKIYAWPAHGNTSNGESYWMAPFWDYDSDGSYFPDNGDYPLIKGCCATWRVDNDDAGPHTSSNTDALGIETHYQTYQYSNFGLLNDVTFVEVTVHNRGSITYPEFAYGMYADTELGGVFDDFIGADSLKSLYYTYNGDNNDTDYGIDPPAFGVVGLENSFTSVVPYTGLSSPAEIWNLMNGLEPSGQPFLDDQNNPRKFVYADNPNISGGWSESELQNLPGDRRAMLSTTHGVFAPGDVITQTYALVYVRDGGGNLQNVDALYAAADEVHAFYDTIANAQCEGGFLSLQENATLLELTMAPNPASNTVDISADVEGVINVQLFDMSGKSILSAEGTKQVQLDVSAIEDGAYLVFVTTESGRVTKKLLVNH